jgi:cleavage and polyadenylation specificity factor subunit 3
MSEQVAVKITPLGAGQEVGRSCIIISYLDKTIMMDCGIHPGYQGHASLPFLDQVDLEKVDVMLITHFHLDHCAAVPFVVGHTNFKGRIFMTHPTKAIAHTLLKDFVKLNSSSSNKLYSDKDVEAATKRTEVIDFQQTIDVDGIKITAYRAGHVLGAAMFMVEVAGMRCLYTGDYSRIADRHMPAADLPVSMRPNIVIVESTYGVSRHLPRKEREEKFAAMVHTSVAKGGRVLLPVVALGRAQELLLILEEYWSKHPELHGVPIYQASGLARRAMTVYRSYIEMMNDDIREAFTVANPFQFKHVTHLKSTSQFDDVGPCVVMATPSMLQSGMSRELFENWCGDSKNCVIIADFAVQGTLARDILSSPSDILARSGARLPLRCQVDAISFSAHADFPQTSEFLDALQPPHVVLVHGEAVEMGRLKKALEQRAGALGITRTVYTPKVTQPVLITHAPRRTAQIMGSLCSSTSSLSDVIIQGVAVKRGASVAIMAQEDLPRYTKLHTGSVTQRQSLSLQKPRTFSDVRLALEMTFDDIAAVQVQHDDDDAQSTKQVSLRVGDCVSVTHSSSTPDRIMLEWLGGPEADMIADAVIALILQSADEPPGICELEETMFKAIKSGDTKSATMAQLKLLSQLLNAQFGTTKLDEKQGIILVQVDGKHVVLRTDLDSGHVIDIQCADSALKSRVGRAVDRMKIAMQCIQQPDDTNT